jgi:hypothetical protein
LKESSASKDPNSSDETVFACYRPPWLFVLVRIFRRANEKFVSNREKERDREKERVTLKMRNVSLKEAAFVLKESFFPKGLLYVQTGIFCNIASLKSAESGENKGRPSISGVPWWRAPGNDDPWQVRKNGLVSCWVGLFDGRMCFGRLLCRTDRCLQKLMCLTTGWLPGWIREGSFEIMRVIRICDYKHEVWVQSSLLERRTISEDLQLQHGRLCAWVAWRDWAPL